jgi:(p)ppGpp synthase/HD superfamily hydrolase
MIKLFSLQKEIVLVWLLESLPKSALNFARQKHAGQKRKFSGQDYIEHPKGVAKIVKQFKKSHRLDQLIKAALLHDTREDTDTTEEELRDLFGGLIASLVKELTSDKEESKRQGKATYLSNKMIAMSSWALVIKLADRLQNVGDLATASPAWAKKYSKETRTILYRLKMERKLSATQDRLVKAIYRKMESAGY